MRYRDGAASSPHNTQTTAASSLRSGIAVITDTSFSAAMRGPGQGSLYRHEASLVQVLTIIDKLTVYAISQRRTTATEDSASLSPHPQLDLSKLVGFTRISGPNLGR